MQTQTNQVIINNQWDAVPIGTAHNNDVVCFMKSIEFILVNGLISIKY